MSTARTGSTLLSTMLNMHPQVLSTLEEPFAYSLYPKYKNITNWTDEIIEEFCYDFYLFSEGKLEPQFGKKEDLITILKEYKTILTGERALKLAYFAFFPNKNKTNITTIVDKELKFHNILNEIADIYPKSKFIVLCRDPRDNVLIKLKRAKKKNKRQSIIHFAKAWNYEYGTINKKISKLAKDRYIRVKYEDLVTKPEETLKIISEFLNIQYTNEMLNYDQNVKEIVSTNNLYIGDTIKHNLSLFHEGLTQKVNTDKVGIWKKELSIKENNIIWSVCKNTALYNGYSDEECKTVFYFRFNMIYDLLRFQIQTVIIPVLYFALPFKIKYLIKKIKYSKNFKGGTWVTKDFYENTITKK